MFTVDTGKFQNYHLLRLQDFLIDPGCFMTHPVTMFQLNRCHPLSKVTAVIENQIICILANYHHQPIVVVVVVVVVAVVVVVVAVVVVFVGPTDLKKKGLVFQTNHHEIFAIENPTANMFALRHAWRNLSLLGFLGQHPTIGSDSRGDFLKTLNPEIQKNMTMAGKSTMKMYFLLKIGIFQCHVRF